jgi:type IV pilus assembly protein PilM
MGSLKENSSSETNIFHYFPPPDVLTPPACGIDISDTTIKFISLTPDHKDVRVSDFGEKQIEPGIVESGEIKKPKELARALQEFKKEHKLVSVHASLPEERAYLFETEIVTHNKESIRNVIEFHLEENVPLSPEEVVFDYDIVEEKQDGKIRLSVSVMPREVVERYTESFERAELGLESLEIEAQAISRAVVPRGDERAHMIVDFGRTRTGVAIVSKEIVRFTSTVEMGGDILTNAIKETKGVPLAEAEKIKETQGIYEHSEDGLGDKLILSAKKLSGEIDRHVNFWAGHSFGKGGAGVEKVLLCGGNATVPGVKEYLRSNLGIEVEIPNVWRNVFDLDEFVPLIKHGDSMGFATSIGLALKSLKNLGK